MNQSTLIAVTNKLGQHQFNNKITRQMKQNLKLYQKNSQHDLIKQQLLATSTLRDLTQEEDHSFNFTKPNVTYRYRQRSNQNSHINSWSAQNISLQPKETSKNKPFIYKIQQLSRKDKRKTYQHTSTTLLQLSQSIEILTQASKNKKNGKQKSRNRITLFSSFNERNKMFLKRLKKQRSHIKNTYLPNGSYEDNIKINQLKKNKNRQSSAIKKIKCEMIQKIKLKDEQNKTNLQSINTSKIRFSLQPKIQNMRARYVTFEGEKQIQQPKQHHRKIITRSLYNTTVRQPKREIKYSKLYTEDCDKRDRGLICSKQFKILINLLKKERKCQDKTSQH